MSNFSKALASSDVIKDHGLAVVTAAKTAEEYAQLAIDDAIDVANGCGCTNVHVKKLKNGIVNLSCNCDLGSAFFTLTVNKVNVVGEKGKYEDDVYATISNLVFGNIQGKGDIVVHGKDVKAIFGKAYRCIKKLDEAHQELDR